jgi:hypothetical protein
MKTNLPPGRELDALIAEKIMGLHLFKYRHYNISGYMNCEVWVTDKKQALENIETIGNVAIDLKSFSTSIEAAWQVVEKVGKRFCLIAQESENLKAKAWFLKDIDLGYPVSYGETAAHAICLAALRTLE